MCRLILKKLCLLKLSIPYIFLQVIMSSIQQQYAHLQQYNACIIINTLLHISAPIAPFAERTLP